MAEMGRGCVKTLAARRLAKDRLQQKPVERRSAGEDGFRYSDFVLIPRFHTASVVSRPLE